jgi:hypothetical protein
MIGILFGRSGVYVESRVPDKVAKKAAEKLRMNLLL